MRRSGRLLLAAGLISCAASTGSTTSVPSPSSGSEGGSSSALDTTSASASPSPASIPGATTANENATGKNGGTGPVTASSSSPTGHVSFAEWVRARLPKGGALETGGPGGADTVRVVHTVQSTDTPTSIARAYLDLTDVYLADDLAKEIPMARPGAKIVIPHLLAEPYKDPEHDRLGWPGDGRGLRAIFLVGAMALKPWIATLDRVASHGMNAVVLDAKEYEGPVTYPTKVGVAIETGAAAKAPIANLARTIRFAHARGIRVIMRISCFHDPWAAQRAPRLALKGKWGGAYPIGWLDPTNDDVHKYIIDLANESMDAGADEIQLDYVRFPVQKGLGNAVLPPADGSREKLIKAFAHKVHEVTKARGVPLSLDVFGVSATGTVVDEHNLGQNIGMLGSECEALSPMVYPAHYDKGYMGWDQPGNHPEIIAIGTKAAVEKLHAAKVTSCVVRPWLQAFGWRCPDYGPKYLFSETQEADKGGGAGWLMWNPGCDYGEAWRGMPITKK